MTLLKSHTHNGTCPGGWFLGGYSFGLERTVIRRDGEGPYLGRWILYLGNRTLRLHKFYRGDDARAPHDHPWTFWTMPLCSGYWEHVNGAESWVTGWRFHRRPSSYQHIVRDPPRPFYTIVVTGKKDRTWGFWPEGQYVYWKDWK